MHALRLLLLASVVSLAAACSSGPDGGAAAEPAGANAGRIRVGDDRRIAVKELSRADRQEIEQAWRLFLAKSPMWRLQLHSIVERGGAGPYILAENLFRHFFTASIYNQTAEIERVARGAAQIGEPAAAYFAKPLVEDLVPLGREVVADVPDPNDPKRRIKKTFKHFQIDDYTRRDAARVLVAIGAGAVPTLSSPALLRDARPSGRRYAAFALGRIATDEAVASLVGLYREAQDWQDRADAVQALGAALPKNPAARPTLEAALEDRDAFVRKQADRALAGKGKLPF